MRKILLLVILLFATTMGWAQEKEISGRVVSIDDGTALPGVNVILKGSTSGAVTDANGTYKIVAPTSGGTLVFSFIGLRTLEVEIGSRSTIDVELQADVTQLAELVVTALGLERKRNELPYAAQEVQSDEITRSRNSNFVGALSGKIAGLDVKMNNNMGGSTNVVIRGYKSITGNNQALFVIDGVPVTNVNNNTAAQSAGGIGVDYGNAASDINPDNILSVNVLKGAAATALYGSRAANGVIMITTKKGRKNSLDVAINTGVTFGKIDKTTYARYQDEYGGGYETGFYSDDLGEGVRDVTLFDHDASYGPKFDPALMVYQWDALDPFDADYKKARPWLPAKNDPSTFFERSVNSNNNVTISGGGDQTTFKLAYTRSDEKGVLPNSKLDKDLVNFSLGYTINPKISVNASANYSRIEGVGRYGTGYSGNNPNQQFRQWWQTNVDIKEQKEAYFRNEKNVTWNWADLEGSGPIYSDNPYWTRYQNYANDSRDHYFGYVSLNYKLTNWLEIIGRAAVDGSSEIQEERVAVGSAGTSFYGRFNRTYKESNFDLLLNFNKNISNKISFKGLLGSNLRRSEVSSIRATSNGGLVVPKLYSLSNSRNPIQAPVENYEQVGVDGIFANASFGYKELVFLELAGRKDKSTTLPKGSNSFFYPSVGANFVFSNAIKTSFLSHGKLRANYAEVGNDAPALSLYDVYDNPASFGSIPVFSLPNTKNNILLKPERTKNIEAGIEAEFFQSRVGFDFTWYKSNTFDQIIPVSVTSATGYTAAYVNSGEVQNKGIEVSAFVVPVETKNFSWRVTANFSRNRNEVMSLYGEGNNKVTNVQIAAFQGGVSVNAAVGQPYGVIRGTNFVYTNGQKTVNAQGYYAATSSSAEIIGNPNPDWLGGLNNRLEYKDIAFNFLIDVRQGGQIFSLDQWYGEATGLYENSAGLNELGNLKRTPVSEGGGILLPGVQADGTPNTVRAENLDGFGQTPFGYVAGGSGAPRAMYVYDGSYIKLREVALTYSFPKSWLERTKFVKGISVSLVGRNLWIIKKNMEYADPEESLSSGNSNSGYQSGAYPAVKTYGFNVGINL